MKTLAIIVVVLDCVYLLAAKLAVFMLSLMAIVFAPLFTRNMFLIHKQQELQKRGIRS